MTQGANEGNRHNVIAVRTHIENGTEEYDTRQGNTRTEVNYLGGKAAFYTM